MIIELSYYHAYIYRNITDWKHNFIISTRVQREKKMDVSLLIQSVFQTECDLSMFGIDIGYYWVFINNELG